ncbi:MAG: hypothetical protein FJY21_09170 [Bacteroidetes bacterium]|nr:hypothetical protein [Bacteroidota bacterium]
MKIYKANRKGYINYVLMGFIILPLFIFFMDINLFSEKPYILLPLLSPSALIFWIYFDTFYKIENDELIYRSAFLRGKIGISKIREIIKGKTLWIGVKAALSTKGIIIKYNKYDELYIAPENNEELIADLLKLNQEIIVKDHN